MSRWKIALVLLTAVAVGGCGMKRQSLGSRHKVIVISDSTLFGLIEEDLSRVMAQEIFTPQTESIFTVSLRPPEELAGLTRFPNLMIVGTLESTGRLGELMSKFLSESSRQRVLQDSAFIFSKKNPWATDQMLAVLVSRDAETLRQNIRSKGQTVFELFDRHEQELVFNSLYAQFEQKEISQRLMEKHGWSVRVQHDYFVAVDSSEIRYVWLRRFGPQRWLSVYWEPTDDPAQLSKEWMLDRRRLFAETFYDGDFVYEDSTLQVQEKVVDFAGRYAVRLNGIWQNEKHVMGGPFRSYGFYNESDKRLYLIDLAVYAPGERKTPYLRQLDGIASTFVTR